MREENRARVIYANSNQRRRQQLEATDMDDYDVEEEDMDDESGFEQDHQRRMMLSGSSGPEMNAMHMEHAL